MSKFIHYINAFFVTGFGSGYFPKAPGTVGSVVGVGVLLAMCSFLDNTLIPSEKSIWWLSISVAFLALLGTYFSDIYAKKVHNKDPKQVVIDEIAGIFVTYLVFILLVREFPIFVDYCQEKTWDISGLVAYFTSTDNGMRFYVGIIQSVLFIYVLPFIFFRLFDILKPWPIGPIDKKVKGGLGIMLDDIVAGIIAGIMCYASLYLYDEVVYISQKYC